MMVTVVLNSKVWQSVDLPDDKDIASKEIHEAMKTWVLSPGDTVIISKPAPLFPDYTLVDPLTGGAPLIDASAKG